jgi:hypothetical protein
MTDPLEGIIDPADYDLIYELPSDLSDCPLTVAMIIHYYLYIRSKDKPF